MDFNGLELSYTMHMEKVLFQCRSRPWLSMSIVRKKRDSSHKFLNHLLHYIRRLSVYNLLGNLPFEYSYY